MGKNRIDRLRLRLLGDLPGREGDGLAGHGGRWRAYKGPHFRFTGIIKGPDPHRSLNGEDTLGFIG